MVAGGLVRRALSGLAASFLALALALTASPALAMTQDEVNAMLRDDDRVRNGLLRAAILAHIVEECDDFRAPSRLVRSAYFLSLYNHARRLGASRAQIDAFVDDKEQQAWFEAQMRRYIESTGAHPDDPASVCALGRAEIAAGTQIGRQLRER